MTADITPTKSCFSIVNGIEVYDNGEVKLWRDPKCQWWRRWDEESCPLCGTKRDCK
jgi:hypothetical protein